MMLLYHPITLIQTIRSNDLDLLTRIIKKDRETVINHINNNKLLHVAVSTGHTNVVKYLLTKGINPNILDYQENSIAHAAIMAGHKKLAYNILKLKSSSNVYGVQLNIDLNIKNSNRDALIHLATKKGYGSIIKLLYMYNVDLDILDFHGNSAINIAVQSGHEDIVKYLLNKGANPNIPDRYGNTPLYYAILEGYESIESILINGGASNNILYPIIQNHAALFKAIKDNDIKEIMHILDNGNINIDATEVYIMTPLHFAAYYNNYFIAKVLLIYGANPNVHDRDGNTILHLIAKSGNVEFSKILIKYGSTINTYNKEKTTPLELAVEHDHVNLVKLLLMCGATINQGRMQDILQLKVTQCKSMEEQWKNTLSKNNIFDINFKKYVSVLCNLKQLFEIMPGCQNEEYNKLYSTYNIYFSNNKPVFSLKILSLAAINEDFDADDLLHHPTIQDVLAQCNINLLGDSNSDV